MAKKEFEKFTVDVSGQRRATIYVNKETAEDKGIREKMGFDEDNFARLREKIESFLTRHELATEEELEEIIELYDWRS